MTRVPMGSSVGGRACRSATSVRDRYRGVEGFAADAPMPFNQGVGAEMIAARWGFSRAQLDEYALASHEKAAAAQDAGAFDAEIAPVPADGAVTADEGIRRDTSLAKLGRAGDPVPAPTAWSPPAPRRRSPTARPRSRSPPREWAAAHGLRPLARIHTAVVAADDPVDHAHRAHPGHREGAAPRRAGHRRDRRVRGERGVRAGAAGLAGGDRRRPGPAQPARRRDRARPPARRAPAPGS